MQKWRGLRIDEAVVAAKLEEWSKVRRKGVELRKEALQSGAEIKQGGRLRQAEHSNAGEACARQALAREQTLEPEEGIAFKAAKHGCLRAVRACARQGWDGDMMVLRA